MAAAEPKRNLPPIFSIQSSALASESGYKGVLAAHDAAVRKALAVAIRRSPMSREEICERMSDLLGPRIMPGLLNRWTAASKSSARFPLCLVDVFCRVTADDTLKRITLGPKLRELLELGERVAAILDRHVQKQLLAPGNGDVKSRRKSAIRLKAAAKSQRTRHPNGRRGQAQEARA